MTKPTADTHDNKTGNHKGGHQRTPGTHVKPDAPDHEAGATGVGPQRNHEDEMPSGDGNYIDGKPLAGPDND